MRPTIIIGVCLVVAAVVLALYFGAVRQGRFQNEQLRMRADALAYQAHALEDSALRLRSRPPTLNAEERGMAIDQLELQAAELLNQAELMRQTRPFPAAEMSAAMLEKAQALSDSVEQIRTDVVQTRGFLGSDQERELARLDQRARELVVRAQLLSRGGSTAQQLDDYNACILIYGEGAKICEQLRGAQPVPPKP